jgi:WD40 repeat protein/serine/threonine protein kinase
MSTESDEPPDPMPPFLPPVKLDPLVFPGATPPFEQGARADAPVVPPCVPGYEILDEVGRGGMGVVYRAREMALKRLVALKIILSGAHASAKERQRFRAEAEAVARLQHPNIVQIYQVGEHLGLPYLALEFCGGGTLASKLRGRRLEPRQAATLVQTLAQAMHAAHERNVIHRDLKPDNILISHIGSDANTYWPVSPNSTQIPGPGLLRITDFGLAKILDESRLTSSGAVLGTPSYMAPEQARGGSEQIGPATDIYALGVLLYEMLTGRPPFHAPTGIDTLMQVIGQEPAPPRKLFAHIPRDLELICLKCLHKDPAGRYASAADLAEDLRRFLGGETVHARPESWLDQTRRLLGPHKSRGIIVALLVTIIGLLLLVRHHAREADRLTDEVNKLAVRKPSPAAVDDAAAVVKLAKAQQQLALAEDRLRSAQLMRVDTLAERDPWQALHILHDKALFPPGQRDPAWHYYENFCKRGGSRILDAQDSGVPCVAFSHHGNLLACGGRSGAVRLWDMALGSHGDLAPVHARRVLVLAWNPDDTRLASAGEDGKIVIWRVISRQRKVLEGHKGRVVGLAWYADGKTLASAGSDGMIRLWNAGDGKEQASWRAGATLLAMAWSRDGSTLATAGDDNTIQLWDPATRQVRAVLHGHTDILHDVAFSDDGKSLATGSADGSVRLWDVASATWRATLPGHDGGTTAVAWHPGGVLLASAGGDSTMRLWNTATGQEQMVLRGLPRLPMSLSWNHDGSALAVGSFDSASLHLWQCSAPVVTLPWQPLGPVALALSADGRLLATAGEQMVKVSDCKSGKAVAVLRDTALTAPSPNGQWLATAQDGTVVVKAAATGQLHATLRGYASQITALLWSADSQTLATAGGDGTIRLWHVGTGEPRAVLRGHKGRVTALAWSEGERFLVSLSADGTIKVWQVGPTD